MQHVFGPAAVGSQEPAPSFGLTLDCVYSLRGTSAATQIGYTLLVPLTTTGILLLASLFVGLIGRSIAWTPAAKKPKTSRAKGSRSLDIPEAGQDETASRLLDSRWNGFTVLQHLFPSSQIGSGAAQFHLDLCGLGLHFVAGVCGCCMHGTRMLQVAPKITQSSDLD